MPIDKTKEIIVKVYRISAITISVRNMEKSCKFYSRMIEKICAKRSAQARFRST